MDTDSLAIFLIFGLPVISFVTIKLFREMQSWHLKSRELALRERQVEMQEQRAADQLNAQIIRMDDYGAVSQAAVDQLREEIRQLRDEVSRLRTEQNQRLGS